jgi:hypothetical protein
MPPRFLPAPFALRVQKPFHSSSRLWSPPNHYETLQIPSSATPAEVKKYVNPLSTGLLSSVFELFSSDLECIIIFLLALLVEY